MWAFFYLKNEFSYQDALRDILMRGGDTDTNAAIIGGLLGASEGINGINLEMVMKVLNFDPAIHQGNNRP